MKKVLFVVLVLMIDILFPLLACAEAYEESGKYIGLSLPNALLSDLPQGLCDTSAIQAINTQAETASNNKLVLVHDNTNNSGDNGKNKLTANNNRKLPKIKKENAYTTLKPGSKGQAVLEARMKLYELGYFKNKPTQTEYTTAMKDYVKRFEKDYGLKEDGILSPEDQEVLFAQGKTNSSSFTNVPSSFLLPGTVKVDDITVAEPIVHTSTLSKYNITTTQAICDTNIKRMSIAFFFLFDRGSLKGNKLEYYISQYIGYQDDMIYYITSFDGGKHVGVIQYDITTRKQLEWTVLPEWELGLIENICERLCGKNYWSIDAIELGTYVASLFAD